MTCACTHSDRFDCADYRSGYDMRTLLDADLPFNSGEECECGCHAPPEDEDDGYDPNACPGCGGNCQTACR